MWGLGAFLIPSPYRYSKYKNEILKIIIKFKNLIFSESLTKPGIKRNGFGQFWFSFKLLMKCNTTLNIFKIISISKLNKTTRNETSAILRNGTILSEFGYNYRKMVSLSVKPPNIQENRIKINIWINFPTKGSKKWQLRKSIG